MEKITLPNGVRLVYEKTDFIRSMTFGIWVGTGSRFESKKESGISHFIEHMLFKGTKHHSCAALSEAFDALGGQSNAYTTKELTAFYVKALDSKMLEAAGLITEMVMEPLMAEGDVQSERGVILEEIGMYEDDPEDLAIEKLNEAVYPKSALGMPILGTKKSLAGIGREEMLGYLHKHYSGENVVAAISGNFDEKNLQVLCDLLSTLPAGKREVVEPGIYVPTTYLKKKKYEQNHLGFLYPAYSVKDDRKYAAAVLSTILGGGASSRLFQRMRDKEGLCYSVYSYSASSLAEGLFGMYTATGKETEEKAIAAMLEEIEKIKQDGVREDELFRAKEKIKTNILLGLESTGSRASMMARNELIFGRIPDYQEIVDAYECLTREDIQNVACDIFKSEVLSFSAIGRIEKEETYNQMLGR